MEKLTKRQKEITQATIILIAENGFQEFSMRKLAERVGFSEPALYRHFKDKDDLILKTIYYLTQEIKKVMAPDDSPNLAALKQLDQILRRTMLYFSDNGFYTATLYSSGIVASKPALEELFQSSLETSIIRIGELLQTGQIEGQVREDIPSGQMAVIVYGSMRVLVEGWNLSNHQFNLTTEWEQTWKTLKAMVMSPVEVDG